MINVLRTRLRILLVRGRAGFEDIHGNQNMLVQTSQGQSGSAHVVVLGNEKGGSGKSTTALHIAVALMKAGQRVATIDLDCRQQSFTRYINNRSAWARRTSRSMTSLAPWVSPGTGTLCPLGAGTARSRNGQTFSLPVYIRPCVCGWMTALSG